MSAPMIRQFMCRLLTASGLLGSLSFPALAQDATAGRFVEIFDTRCLDPMPDIDLISTAAEAGKWTPVTGKGLDAYKPPVEPKRLAAWTFEDAGAAFSLAVTHSDLDEQGKADFPDFADGQSYACTLILPTDRAKPADVAASLTSLLDRPHDESYEEGPFQVSTWTGATEDRLVFVYHYAPKSGRPGGLLNLMIFEKP